MNSYLNHYGTQDLRNLKPSIIKKIKSSELVTNGNHCIELEKKIRLLTKSKYCVVTNNGTSSLMMGLLSLNLTNIVAIVPNINFVSISNIISILKGKILLCDVDPQTGMINLECFKKIIKDCDKHKIKPNVFIPVHYAGNVVNLKDVSKICKKRKIAVIEDGCHSFGSYKQYGKIKNYVGSNAHSMMTSFSFHPVKNITTLEGGAITTNTLSIYKKLLLLRSHSLKNTFNTDPYELKMHSLNFRLSEINAIIGLDQIKQINFFKNKRNKIFKSYLKNLSYLNKYIKPLNQYDKNIFWHLFVIQFNIINMKLKSKFMKFLKKNKIGSQIHYKPLHMHKFYKKIILLNHHKNSDIFYKKSLSLPLHTRMNLKDVTKVAKVIKRFYKIHNV